MNLLFCDNYRGDEALPVYNANNKGWANFSRLTIILLIYEFTKCKMALASWLLLLKTKKIYASYLLENYLTVTLSRCLTAKKQSLLALNKGSFTLQRF